MIQLPEKFMPLFTPAPYKVAKSGRGGLKSWSFARALLAKGYEQKLKILCGREYQTSIKDSVYALLQGQAEHLGIDKFYDPVANELRGKNGTLFIFRGIRNNPQEIKSMEGLDICWIEEAQNTSRESWEILIPTIRKENSEIWISYNQKNERDSTHQQFWVNSPPGTIKIHSNWRFNPWMSQKSIADKDHCLATDPDGYEYIWEDGFEVIRQGAYYHKLVMEAEKAGRICNVPHDPNVLVHVSWDIGLDDENFMWFWQVIPGGEYHLIDCEFGTDEGIDYYLDTMEGRLPDTEHRKKYRYGTLYAPHDFKARAYAANGRSSYSIAKARGYKVSVGKRIGPGPRIEATRAILPMCWFDKGKTEAKGLWSLKNYKRKFDDNRQTFINQPDHDAACHGADSFGEFAVRFKKDSSSYDSEADQKEAFDRLNAHNQNSWMSQ